MAKNKKKTKKKLTKPKYIIIMDNPDDNYENNLEIAKLRTEKQVKSFLIENYDRDKSQTIDVYKLGNKIDFDIQTNVEHLVKLKVIGDSE